MAIVLALPRLYDAVVARFAAEGTAVPNLFGWREPAQKLVNGSRICWVPGDDTGALGDVGPAKYPGRVPRSIATLLELFTVTIQANDPSSPENERLQYQAVRELFDAWYRAVHLAAYGTFQVVSTEWVTDKKERRFGAALRVACTIEAMIPDPISPDSVTDATEAAKPDPMLAEVETTVLDVSETDTFSADDT